MSRNKNTIWSDSLLEDSLCSGIGQFSSITNTAELIHVSGRDVESYQYSVNQTTKDTKSKNHLTGPDLAPKSINEEEGARKEASKEEVKKRLGALVAFDENKSRSRIHVTEIDTEDNVAREIAKYLREEKIELICK